MAKYETATDFSPCTDWIIAIGGAGRPDFSGLVADSLPEPMEQDFRATAGTVFILRQDDRRYFFLGMGEDLSFGAVQSLFRSFVYLHRDRLQEKTGLLLAGGNQDILPSLCAAAVQGIESGIRPIGIWKTENKAGHTWDREESHLWFLVPAAQKVPIEEVLRRSYHISMARSTACRWINTPANFLNPPTFADEIVQAGRLAGFEVTLHEGESLAAKGFHALAAVGRGSRTPPVLAELHYRGIGKVNKHIGLVGKGITFDTGGISLKSSTNMHFMKSDMSGAAVVAGVFLAVAGLGLPIKLTGLLPLAENAIGPDALRPGDIISSYSGKTIEVIDTDAEGRLILADALSYLIHEHAPDHVVDLATLTGSIVATLGNHAAGLFANDDKLAKQLLESGEQSGEFLWRMPLPGTVADELKSDVADLKNFSGLPTAGALSAAKFLETFVKPHPSWAHFDIAGVSFDKTELTSMKAATGFGIRLLTEWIDSLS